MAVVLATTGACGEVLPVDEPRTTPEPPAFSVELEGPGTVPAGWFFEVRFVTDVPARELTSSAYADLNLNGEPAWVLSERGDVRRADHAGQDTVAIRGHGPHRFRAPSEPGLYELCKSAFWRGTATPCTPLEITPASSDQPATFDLRVVAPTTVTAGAAFEVAWTSDVALEELSAGAYTELRQYDRGAWALLKTGEVIRMRDFDIQDHLDAAPSNDHGPWILTAPPEPGRYELCMGATRRFIEHGDERYGGEAAACTPLEVVAR